MMEITPTWYIGVDPGEKTGVAEWHTRKKKILRIRTMSFWELYKEAARRADPNFHATEQSLRTYLASVVYVVEDPGQNKPTFDHSQTDPKVREKISQDVGRNCREAELLILGLRELGYTVETVRPLGQSGVQRKKRHEEFRRHSGYTQRVSQHGRDAASLVIGRE